MKKISKTILTVTTMAVVFGTASSTADAQSMHCFRKITKTPVYTFCYQDKACLNRESCVAAGCYRDGYCLENGTCDVDGICINGGNCSAANYYKNSNLAENEPSNADMNYQQDVIPVVAGCYVDGYCAENGSCDVNGVCVNGGNCNAADCYRDGYCVENGSCDVDETCINGGHCMAETGQTDTQPEIQTNPPAEVQTWTQNHHQSGHHSQRGHRSGHH